MNALDQDDPDISTTARTEQSPGHREWVPVGDQCRCSCGSLVARMITDGLELKCRKCKRLILIGHAALSSMYRELNLSPPMPPARER